MDRLPFAAEELEENLVRRFRSVARHCGEHAAVVEDGRRLSYAALDAASDSLAAFLLAKLGEGSEPVALLYKHGVDHIVSQLAVLKAGKFCSTLDTELAGERQVLILENLAARLLLCDAACHGRALALADKLGSLRVISTTEVHAAEAQVEPKIDAGDPAFVVYTSGSTGAPQGVLLSHRNLLMVAFSHGRDFALSAADRASQLCSLWSAASASEIFSALLSGATLYPFSVKDRGVFAFLQLAEEEALTTLTATPVLFRMLFTAAGPARRFPAMRLIRLGGDRTTRQDVALYKRVFGDHCRLRLGYGSSEYLLVTQLFIDKRYEMTSEIAPVGHAMEGCELRLLDDDLQEVGPGQYGQIAVSSHYLSPGYWRNAELDRQRYPELRAASGLRCYLTQDIGRLDERGCLHHLGRCDSRVKIYGKLVVMTDIERELLAIDGVKEAVVLPRDSGERGTELTAFVVLEEEGRVDEATMRRLLRERLPAELLPRSIRVLERMPLLVNNKINRLRLKELAGADAGETSPAT